MDIVAIYNYIHVLVIILLHVYSLQLPAEANFETILMVVSGNPFQNMYLRYSDSDSGKAEPPAKLYMVEYVTTESAGSSDFKTIFANSRRIISSFMIKHGSSKLV